MWPWVAMLYSIRNVEKMARGKETSHQLLISPHGIMYKTV